MRYIITENSIPVGLLERNCKVLVLNSLLPICPNMIGGILLFSQALPEEADYIYASSRNLPVAYASNNVNSTANLARGSMNLTESKALENGYKFVWEFTPSQGNGTIAAALTSAQGGTNGYGSQVGDASTFLQLKSIRLEDLSQAKQMVLFEAVEVDFENNLLYSITYQGTGIRVHKVQVPIFSLGLNEKLDDTTYTMLDNQEVQTSTFQFLGSYTLYGEFLDGGDGYWYGFSNEGNSSGSATMVWAKIKKENYSVTEGQWTLSNAKLMDVGNRDTNGSFPERMLKCCMRNGYLYVMANNKKGIYKINTANSSDVTLIPLGFTSKSIVKLEEDTLIITPVLFMASRPERNLLAVVSRMHDYEYSKEVNDLEQLMITELESYISEPNIAKHKHLRVDLPDVDFAIFDRLTNSVMICETKWFAAADSTKEVFAKEDEITHGCQQVEDIMAYAMSDRKRLMKQVFNIDDVNTVDLFGCVVAKHNIRTQHKYVPVIDLKRIEELLSKYSLNSVFHLIRNHEYEIPLSQETIITHQNISYAGFEFRIPAICFGSSQEKL